MKTESVQIDTKKVSVIRLKKEDYCKAKIKKIISDFSSGSKSYDDVLKKYDPHVSTLLFLYENDSNLTGIAYCKYCCASMKVGNKVYPSIEIKTFAVAKQYQSTYFSNLHLKVSKFVMRKCIDFFQKISRKYLHACFILLYAEDKPKVHAFYENLGYIKFSADCRTFTDQWQESRECRYYYKLCDTV